MYVYLIWFCPEWVMDPNRNCRGTVAKKAENAKNQRGLLGLPSLTQHIRPEVKYLLRSCYC